MQHPQKNKTVMFWKKKNTLYNNTQKCFKKWDEISRLRNKMVPMLTLLPPWDCGKLRGRDHRSTWHTEDAQ